MQCSSPRFISGFLIDEESMFRWVLVRQKNAVITEEKLNENGARLELLPHKSVTRLSQQARVLTTIAWRVIKKLYL